MAQSKTPLQGIRHIDGVMVIQPPQQLIDRLDITTAADAWLMAIENERPLRVIISFDQVRFFSSEAIGVVIRIAKRVRSYGGDIRLCNMGKMVRDIFQICQLIPKLFELHDSTADAIASFDR